MWPLCQQVADSLKQQAFKKVLVDVIIVVLFSFARSASLDSVQVRYRKDSSSRNFFKVASIL
jgi:hypothetical protein